MDKLVHSWLKQANQIINEVIVETGYSRLELLSHRRQRGLVQARWAAWERIRRETPMSLPEIGRLFNRDHTTVLHGLRWGRFSLPVENKRETCSMDDKAQSSAAAGVPYDASTLRRFLMEAAWSLGTRCNVLENFTSLGDDAGCHYVSKQITAEAKAIANAVQMLMQLRKQADGEGPG